MQSVLAKASAADVQTDPFPFLVVEDCLPRDLYEALARSYPDDAQVVDLGAWRRRGDARQNQRNDISAHQVVQQPGIVPPLWEEFVRYHTSPAFYRETAQVFGPAIRAVYPELEARLGCAIDAASTGVRHVPEADTGQLSLDCQIGINTPATQSGSVRRVHADAPEELFAMLLYFRREEDDSRGGDLEIHRWKPRRAPRFRAAEADDDDALLVRTVPYRANTLVAFINTDRSLHAVSPREPSPHSRRLVNIIGEVYRSVPEGLFAKPQIRRMRLHRAIGKLRDRLGV